MSNLDVTDAACIELARTIIANDYQGEDAYVDLGTCNTESLCKSLERIERQIRDGIAALEEADKAAQPDAPPLPAGNPEFAQLAADVAKQMPPGGWTTKVQPDADEAWLSGVDSEIRDLVRVLNRNGFHTIASCSGHGHRPGNIALRDGRELIIARDYEEARKIDRLFPFNIHGEMVPQPDADEAAPYPYWRRFANASAETFSGQNEAEETAMCILRDADSEIAALRARMAEAENENGHFRRIRDEVLRERDQARARVAELEGKLAEAVNMARSEAARCMSLIGADGRNYCTRIEAARDQALSDIAAEQSEVGSNVVVGCEQSNGEKK